MVVYLLRKVVYLLRKVFYLFRKIIVPLRESLLSRKVLAGVDGHRFCHHRLPQEEGSPRLEKAG